MKEWVGDSYKRDYGKYHRKGLNGCYHARRHPDRLYSGSAFCLHSEPWKRRYERHNELLQAYRPWEGAV